MENIFIRPATMQDLDTLLQFEQGVIEAELPFDPTLKRDPTRYYDIEEMIRAPHIHLLVAQLSGAIVASGYARIETSRPYLQHTRHAYLGFMYVEPSLRGKGINKMIIESLKQWSISMDITEMRLDVYVQNTGAIAAYEKAGFKQHMVEMRTAIT